MENANQEFSLCVQKFLKELERSPKRKHKHLSSILDIECAMPSDFYGSKLKMLSIKQLSAGCDTNKTATTTSHEEQANKIFTKENNADPIKKRMCAFKANKIKKPNIKTKIVSENNQEEPIQEQLILNLNYEAEEKFHQASNLEAKWINSGTIIVSIGASILAILIALVGLLVIKKRNYKGTINSKLLDNP